MKVRIQVTLGQVVRAIDNATPKEKKRIVLEVLAGSSRDGELILAVKEYIDGLVIADRVIG